MADYVYHIGSAKTAMELALKNLARGELEKVKSYLDAGLEHLNEVTGTGWSACGGECERCDLEGCKGLTEREALEFSKMLKELSVLRLKRRIEETDARLGTAAPEGR